MPVFQCRVMCESSVFILHYARVSVPCDAGYYLPSRHLETCLPCPQGTYQDTKGQMSCKPCIEGTTTLTMGSDHPVMCNVRQSDIITINATSTHSSNFEGYYDDVREEDVEDILSVL